MDIASSFQNQIQDVTLILSLLLSPYCTASPISLLNTVTATSLLSPTRGSLYSFHSAQIPLITVVFSGLRRSLLTMTAAKISSLSLYFTLFLFLSTTHFPISDAEIRRQSLNSQDVGVPAQELWCVAKNNAEDAALQSAIDWACNAGGADCAPIQQGGPCYDPSNIQNTASYVFNDYFLKHGLSDDSCNFDNTAAITSINPSHDNCKFPSSLKAATASSGNFSGSTSSPLGMGTGEDMSGCSDVTGNWSWALIISHLVLMFCWTVLG